MLLTANQHDDATLTCTKRKGKCKYKNLTMFALQVKKERAQICLRHQRRLKSLTGHEFNSSDSVLENGDSSFSDLDLNTSMSMSSDSSPTPLAPYLLPPSQTPINLQTTRLYTQIHPV
ncbi:hypothetical protein BDR07DRAFT_826770 [Suillus spraguei]|nr:hypothetical protein BDR07DRAFT_826770 [Suillus spraguei]